MCTIVLILSILHARATVPSPPEWQHRLDMVAKDVGSALLQPKVPSFRDDHAWQRFADALHVAEHWPHPEFREPLLGLLDHADASIVLGAARGLLLYNDSALDGRVESLGQDRRRVQGDNAFQLGSLIRQAQADRVRLRAQRVCADADILSVACDGDIPVWSWGIETIPQAVGLLADGDLSVRMKAWLWLAVVGLVIDASPLVESWPLLADVQRTRILEEVQSVRWGDAELRAGLERILENADGISVDEHTRGWLLITLGQLRSDAIREPCLELIHALEKSPRRGDAEESEQAIPFMGLACFRALGPVAAAEDLPLLVRLTCSDQAMVRLGALHVLAYLDEPRAVAAVLDFISRGERPPATLRTIDPYDALRSRRWLCPGTRETYVQFTCSVLLRRVAEMPPLSRLQEIDRSDLYRPASEHIELLEAMTQTTLGPTGRRMPSIGVLDVSSLRETAGRWQRLLETRSSRSYGADVVSDASDR